MSPRSHVVKAPGLGHALGGLLGPFLLALLAGPPPALAGPLDPDDAAEVRAIDSKVTTQIGQASAATTGMDGLVDQAEFAIREIGYLLAINQASLQLDLEQLLLGSCAPRCAKAPAPPASVTSARRCWTCVNPRLIIPNRNGGYLENVLDLVADDLQAVIDAGLDIDTLEPRRLVELANQAAQGEQFDSAFTFACQAYGKLRPR